MRYHQRLFFCSCTAPRSAGDGGTYTGGVATGPPPGDGLARTGEVWTSPCRESPRRRPRSQRGRCRQGLKLTPAAAARLNMLEDCGPLSGGGGLNSRSCQGAQPGGRLRETL